MLVTLPGIETLARLVQLKNVLSPIAAMLLGSVMLVRPEQFRNALFPRLVTLAGIVTPVKF
jgi:hypothetical protein